MQFLQPPFRFWFTIIPERVPIWKRVGEVEVVGTDVRGIAVHEAARVMGAAAAGEILVSDTTRLLAAAAGLIFEDRGRHDLKGLPEPMHLFAYLDDASLHERGA